MCSEESGCITKELNCQHEHNSECGYSPAAEGTPCGYVCELCGGEDSEKPAGPSNAEAVTVASVQAMIDALPGADEITDDNAEEVEEQLEAIDEAKAQLSDEETDELDMTRYAEAAAALGALAAPMLLANDSPDEQFSLTPGDTYYFDLSGEDIPGTANSGNSDGAVSLPDTSLHYVPFTYAGTVNAYKLTSEMATPNYLDLSGYPEFDNEKNVTVNGRTYPIGTDGGRYVNLPETGDILQRFTYLSGTYSAAHENYPTGMTAYRIIRQEGGAKLEPIDGLEDLLIYSGCSIRISGKQGIRMITGITQNNKKALTSKAGLSGYTLEEYGTLICWNTDVTSGDDFSLDMSCARHNYAYLKGKADPVFAKQDGKMLYTNVLVGFSLEDCAKDLILRPYIKLKDMTTGETVTLYGGSVCRSIGYVARQNENTYKPGSSGYKYVRNIIDAVYGQEP